MRLLLTVIMIAGGASAWADFALHDNGAGRLTILEDGDPVLVYNYGRVDPPADSKADPERYWRESYIHPLYGMNGEVITQDFPSDHYHHRGVFWTWPEVTVGDRRMDIWAIDGARQLFAEWITKKADGEHAVVGVRNHWKFDDDPEPKMREEIVFTVHPASESGRAIDFELRFTNVCGETITLLGAANKGYGGLCFRPHADNKPMHFTAADGPVERDKLAYDTPWADVSWASAESGEEAGLAILQHPANPGYPHPGWIFRHYSFLGVSWPHEESHAIAPGEGIVLRYRMYIHEGDADAAQIGLIAKQYAAQAVQDGSE
jgi:hypothetical protein